MNSLPYASPARSEHVADRILDALRRIIRATDLHSRRLQRDYGMTGPQLVVLRELGSGIALSGSELARAVSVSLPTATGIAARLEARGLVRRTRSGSDRRKILISATEAGQELLDSAPPALQETFARRLLALEEWEQSQMLAVLQRIVAMMESADRGAEGAESSAAAGTGG